MQSFPQPLSAAQETVYLKSKRQVRAIIRDFRTMAAVGVGGYASGATLDAAAAMTS